MAAWLSLLGYHFGMTTLRRYLPRKRRCLFFKCMEVQVKTEETSVSHINRVLIYCSIIVDAVVSHDWGSKSNEYLKTLIDKPTPDFRTISVSDV